MILLSNALSDAPDEGCRKVMTALAKRLKASGAAVITCQRRSSLSDVHLKVNRLLLSPALIWNILKRRERVVYLPFPARPLAMALRVFCLSRYARWGLEVALVMNGTWRGLPRWLMDRSGADFLVFSRETEQACRGCFGDHRVRRLKLGVDTKKFRPVSREEALRLKSAYGLAPDRPVVLHVGHLNRGRNLQQLTKLDPKFQILLVLSTETRGEQDVLLRRELLERGNIRILEGFLPQIQEIYQLSDVYFFPVTQPGHCIDVPLSCLEAAACGLPVVTTDFGEMGELLGKPGFYPIPSFAPEALNRALWAALRAEPCLSRAAVLDYDWDKNLSRWRNEKEGIFHGTAPGVGGDPGL